MFVTKCICLSRTAQEAKGISNSQICHELNSLSRTQFFVTNSSSCHELMYLSQTVQEAKGISMAAQRGPNCRKFGPDVTKRFFFLAFCHRWNYHMCHELIFHELTCDVVSKYYHKCAVRSLAPSAICHELTSRTQSVTNWIYHEVMSRTHIYQFLSDNALSSCIRSHDDSDDARVRDNTYESLSQTQVTNSYI